MQKTVGMSKQNHLIVSWMDRPPQHRGIVVKEDLGLRKVLPKSFLPCNFQVEPIKLIGNLIGWIEIMAVPYHMGIS